MKEKVALLSILTNFILAGGKISVGLISGSTAVLAEGMHSLVDILSSAISYLGVKISQKPADKKHPYGYDKFEVLAGVIITLFLFGTGLGIVYQAYQSYLSPEEIEVSYIVFGVMIVSIVLNEILARIKISIGKKENSLALLSDGLHSRVDVITSLAVFVGLFLSRYWLAVDSLLALLIGLYIIKESFSLGKEAIDSLLDVSAGEEVEEKIREISQKQNIEIASLKTQKRGAIVTANLEIKLPSHLKIEEATKISNQLKESLVQEISNLRYVAIQITSHQTETGFYKPSFGRSLAWQRKGRFMEEIKEAQGYGPQGYCFCPQCGYQVKHQAGQPCANLLCPKCQISLTRKENG